MLDLVNARALSGNVDADDNRYNNYDDERDDADDDASVAFLGGRLGTANNDVAEIAREGMGRMMREKWA